MNGPERRIRERVGELRPVRRIPRLRALLAALVAGWAAVTALDLALGMGEPADAGLCIDPAFLGVFAGLVVAALGVLVAALAGAACLGGVAVQASCSAGDPLHRLPGHSLRPLAAALRLVLPVVAWMRAR